jgi:hypothetical protein
MANWRTGELARWRIGEMANWRDEMESNNLSWDIFNNFGVVFLN